MSKRAKCRGGRYTPPKRSCFGCGDPVDQVEELPEGFYVSGRMHRECAEAMIDAMRAECPICQGDHDGGHDVSGDS